MTGAVIDLAERRTVRAARRAVRLWRPLVRSAGRSSAPGASPTREAFRRSLANAARSAMPLAPGHPLQEAVSLALVAFLLWVDDGAEESLATLEVCVAVIERLSIEHAPLDAR